MVTVPCLPAPPSAILPVYGPPVGGEAIINSAVPTASLPLRSTVESVTDEDGSRLSDFGENFGDSDSDVGDANDLKKDLTTTGGTSIPKYLSWASKKLDKLLEATNRGLTNTVIKWMTKNLCDTKLIFVVGKTGTGKSTFLKEMTGNNIEIGCRMQSGTIQYCVCPAIIGGKHYLFIDTVGLAASDINNEVAFQDLLACISTLGNFMAVTGVLLILDCRAERITDDDLKIFNWLKCFCGPSFYKNITIVFSQWDRVHPREVGKAKDSVTNLVTRRELNDILHPLRPYLGGSVYYHGMPDGELGDAADVMNNQDHVEERSREAKSMILRRYSDAPNGQLQVVMDMVDNDDNWRLTEAAKALFADKPSLTILAIDQDRVVVAGIDGQPQRLLLTDTSRPGPQFVTPHPVAPQPAPASESSRQSESWVESMRRWLEVAKAVAEFFEGRSTVDASYWWNISGAWGKLREWWRGGSS